MLDDGVIKDNIKEGNCIRLLKEQVIVGKINFLLLYIHLKEGAVGSGDNNDSIFDLGGIFPFPIEEIQPILQAYIRYFSSSVRKEQVEGFCILKALYKCCCCLCIKGNILSHSRLKEQT